MGKIIKPGLDIISSIMANDEMKYALKHHKDGLKFKGIWQCDQFRDGKLISGGYPEPPNIFTTEGIARLLNIMFHDIEKAASEIFYVGIFLNNITPVVGNTAAVCLGAAGTYGEGQDADYDLPLTNKPQYTTEDTATATITNAVAGKASFTMANSVTVYGAFLSTVAAKTATSGYLTAAKKFAASRAVIDDDELAIAYEINVTSS